MSRLSHLLPIALCTFSATLAGCGAQASLEKGPASNTSDIVGGQATTGFAAVGALVNFAPGGSGGDLCTATYIGNNRVITAAHCVLALNSAGSPTPAMADTSNVEFYLGSSLAGSIDNSKVYTPDRIALPPGFNFQTFLLNAQNGTYNNNDLAMVHLTTNPTVDIAPVSTAPITDADVGQNLILIGYGTTGKYGDGTTAGVKRTTSVPLNQYNNYLLEAGSQNRGTCSGDSGGPAALNGTLVGVTQSGSTDSSGNCVGDDIFTRVDAWASFINNF